MDHNPAFQPLLRFPQQLIVNLGCVGAVWFSAPRRDGEAACKAADRATLVYDPTLPEGGYKTLLVDDRRVYGHLNTFTAAIAVTLAAHGEATPTPPLETLLPAALGRALAACRDLRRLGHGKVKETPPGMPFTELAKTMSPFAGGGLQQSLPEGFHQVTSNSANYKENSRDTWSLAALAENPPDQPILPLYGLAHRVALYGHSALATIPHAHFGDMLSVDRREMETLRSISQLIRSYQQKAKPVVPKPEPPLSIAAFGPPGAGKSFGIKEIAKGILGPKVPFLEFNLSQFDSAAGLHGAFHQVRDQALKGVTPVVFWDEFDSQNYKWLQYLLGPMQDGVFEENGQTHTIGKCVFVFAGATSFDFAHFGPAPEPTGQPEDKDAPALLAKLYESDPKLKIADEDARADFRRKKGPDFLSRLDAHIDVLGPNRRRLYDWTKRTWLLADANDITFPVRRALLLRQFLGTKKGKDHLLICRDLLHAFLHQPEYHFSARSLEKVAKPAAAFPPPFRRAHLPPPQVLHQHLETAADFDRIYQATQRLLVPTTVDALANAINEGYNCDNPSPWNKAFRDLDPFLQESNRAAAIRIPHILALAGLRLTPREPHQTEIDLADPAAVKNTLDLPISREEQPVLDHLERHLEVLAEEEHRLWVQFHEDNGWSFGHRVATQPDPADPVKTVTTFEKDKAKLLHPCMKDFHDMPDDHGQRIIWQNYDRNAIRRYPRILRLTNLEITFASE